MNECGRLRSEFFLSFSDDVGPYAVLYFEGQSGSDRLDDSWRPSFFTLFDIMQVMMCVSCYL